jgi:DNA-binding NarL/FixJ family response regulator
VSLSVLIVDDHRSFRDLARAFLQAHGYEVVGEAVDGAGALCAAGRLRPDVVLLDVHLPDLDGFEVARRISAAGNTPAVVLVSSRDQRDFGRRVRDSGARGFISKTDLTGRALDATLSGAP